MSHRWILAVDCATENLGVALWCVDTDGSFFHSVHAQRRHAIDLHTIVDESLKQADTSFKDVVGVVTTNGPGSYTGIRIAMASAQGWSDALDIPFVTLSTLEALGLQLSGYADGEFVVWIGAHGGDVYEQRFDTTGVPISGPEALKAEAAAVRLQKSDTLFGNAIITYREMIPNYVTLPEYKAENAQHLRYVDPVILAKLGWDKIKQGIITPDAPLYVHPLTYKKSMPRT